MTRIVCTGLAVHDLVYRLDTPLRPGSKNFATALHLTSGGPAVNAAKAITDLGGEATLMARVGDDAEGGAIAEDVSSRDVTPMLEVVDGVPTSVSSAIVEPDGERTIVNRTDPRLLTGPHAATDDVVDRADAVLTDVRWVDGARAALRAARDAGKPAILDADSSTRIVPADLVALATHIVFARDALTAYTGVDDPAAALAVVDTDGVIGVTLGSKGSLWRLGPDPTPVAAFPVESVSTLGAGDVFHGSFALAVARGREPTAAATFASAAAAAFCALAPEAHGRIDPAQVSRMEHSR